VSSFKFQVGKHPLKQKKLGWGTQGTARSGLTAGPLGRRQRQSDNSNGADKNYRFDLQTGLRETVPQRGMPGTPRRVRMADADEPWMREWINNVADDMMREHSYMEVNLRGSELVSVSLTEVGATCACLLDENKASPGECLKILVADSFFLSATKLWLFQVEFLCVNL